MIKEHDRIVLKTDVPAEGLRTGDVRTVVHLYNDARPRAARDAITQGLRPKGNRATNPSA